MIVLQVTALFFINIGVGCVLLTPELDGGTQMSKLILITLAHSVLVLGQQPPLPVERLVVVDAKGKIVGNVLGVGTGQGIPGPTVALRVADRLLILTVTKLNFLGMGIGTLSPGLFFESSDCTGTPLIRTDAAGSEEGLVTPLSIVAKNKIYSPEGVRAIREIRSMLQLMVFPWDWGCQAYEETAETMPLKMVADLNNSFTPPFSIK